MSLLSFYPEELRSQQRVEKEKTNPKDSITFLKTPSESISDPSLLKNEEIGLGSGPQKFVSACRKIIERFESNENDNIVARRFGRILGTAVQAVLFYAGLEFMSFL